MAIDYARYAGLSPQQVYQQPEFANGLPAGWDWNAWQATVNPASTWGSNAGPVNSLDNQGNLIDWQGLFGGNPWDTGRSTPSGYVNVRSPGGSSAAPSAGLPDATNASGSSSGGYVNTTPAPATTAPVVPTLPGEKVDIPGVDSSAPTSFSPATSGGNLTIADGFARPVTNPVLPQPIFGNAPRGRGTGRAGVVDAMMGRRNRWNSYS
jgi:hypothetical protein